MAAAAIVVLAATASAAPEEDIASLAERGREIFHAPASCATCHGMQGEGLVGPSIQYGPTPFDIHYQLTTNTQMAPFREALDPTDEDLVAISVYIRRMTGTALQDIDLEGLRATLNSIQNYSAVPDYFLTERDRKLQEVESFETVLSDWRRRSKRGNIKHTYEVREVATFDPGEPKFTPEPGGLYFYENLGTSGRFRHIEGPPPEATQVVVGNAKTKEVIASYSLPVELRGSVHTTVMSPDGKFVYIIGSRPFSVGDTQPSLTTPQSLLKVDALTLQPVKQLMIGARLHHGQIFQDRYLLLDSFSRDRNGLDVFLFDPETDRIVGGVRSDELGGSPYTAWTDNEYIYILMEPLGYAPPGIDKTFSGYMAAGHLYTGRLTAIRPFWIAKLDPRSWEIITEYPYPGYRGDWIAFDAAGNHMFVPAGGSSNVSKIDMETGQALWAVPTGIGPYGANLNADETEIWIADKGETTGMFGRTITVLDADTGGQLHTLFSGYQIDHVLLAPNGREFWCTSNAEGRIYVFDAQSHEKTHIIDMPLSGDPHGLVFVHYDERGESMVVRDQGGFHNGIDPRKGRAL
jgi:DNA-binding beta-propeller fold protein YncE/mono/diheme cytochrome c family protein